MPTLPKSALSALNATFSKEQAETLLALLTAVGGSDWDSIVGKPASFPPSAHTHEWEDITDAPEAPTWTTLSGKPATFPPTIGTTASTAAAGNHTHTISDVDDLQAELDGKQAAGSYAPASHTHTIANVSGLQAALDGKAASDHVHDVTEIGGLEDTLDVLEQRIAALEGPEV